MSAWFDRNRHLYPADWPVIARAVKEAAGWRCVRCDHPHDPKAGRTLCPRLFASAILNVWPGHTASALVFIAGMAQALAQRLAGATAIHARDGRGLRDDDAMGQELGTPPVNIHVATTAEDRDVLAAIVARVAIDVVTVCCRCAAALAGAETIRPLRARPLCLRPGGVALPCGMVGAPAGGKSLEVYSGGARDTVPATVSVAGITQRGAPPVDALTVFANTLSIVPHGVTIISPAMPSSKEERHAAKV